LNDTPDPGSSLTSIFSLSLSPEVVNDISRRIIDPGSSFSYKGRIEWHNRNSLAIIANLIIVPLWNDNNEGNPSSYLGIFDDITEEHRSLLQTTFLSLLEASKLKDNDTGNHIARVNEYSRLMTSRLFQHKNYQSVDMEFLNNIAFLAAMHDVGKIGTPDDILNKEGPLDEREWQIMKEHTKNGAFILSTYPNPMAKQIALFHHEKWDGSGYPYQLAEEMIPLPARIVCIADVYDALRMERSYKEAYTHNSAKEIILEGRGSHFDPDLIDLFIDLEDSFSSIYDSLKDDKKPATPPSPL